MCSREISCHEGFFFTFEVVTRWLPTAEFVGEKVKKSRKKSDLVDFLLWGYSIAARGQIWSNLIKFYQILPNLGKFIISPLSEQSATAPSLAA